MGTGSIHTWGFGGHEMGRGDAVEGRLQSVAYFLVHTQHAQ